MFNRKNDWIKENVYLIIVLLISFSLYTYQRLYVSKFFLPSFSHQYWLVVQQYTNYLFEGLFFNPQNLIRLKAENTYLKEQWLETQMNFYFLKKSLEKLDNLNQLSNIKYSEFDLKYAKIIKKNIDPLNARVYLDKGWSSGLEINQFAFAYANDRVVLLGNLINVDENRSELQLLNDINTQLVITYNEYDYYSVLEGLGGFNTSLGIRYVEKSSLNYLQVGDEIFSFPHSDYYPPKVLIGKIASIDYRVTSQDIVIYVTAAYKLSDLSYVAILLPSKNNSIEDLFNS